MHLASPGLLFLTEWGPAGARLVRAAMDGSGRTDLVTEDIVYPQAVTLDFPSRCRSSFLHNITVYPRQVYWVDTYLDHIDRCDYHGHGRTTVARGRLAQNL